MPVIWPDAALAASRAAPLSARKALCAAALLDQWTDAAFERRSGLAPPLATAGDILAFRALLRDLCPELGALMDLVECAPNGPRLQVVAVPVQDFAALPVADLMVSLYNKGTVPRLMLVRADGTQSHMQDLLQAAAEWCRTI